MVKRIEPKICNFYIETVDSYYGCDVKSFQYSNDFVDVPEKSSITFTKRWINMGHSAGGGGSRRMPIC